MKKLKSILQSNKLFIVILLCALLYTFLYLLFDKNVSKYDIDEREFKVKILEIYADGNYLKLIVEGKEKLVCSYYFNSLDEKNNFLANYKLGDIILIDGNLSIPKNNTIPNLFNYKSYLKNESIYYILKIDSYKKLYNNHNIFYSIKNILISRTLDIPLSSSYLKAFILGENKGIDNEVNESYQTIGISHLFAISGMHVSLLSAIILFILKKMRLNNIIIDFIIILFFLLYMFITGFSPSILRASTLFILLKINSLLKLRIDIRNIYLLTISLIMILNPYIVFKIGFLYSSIISGTLIFYSNLINKCKNYLSKLLMTSFISFLVSFPISVYAFCQINFLSVFYNLFFVPFVSFILFPFSLLVFIFPIIDKVLYIFINVIEVISSFCNSIPSVLIFKKPTIFICIIYYVLIFLILNKRTRKKIVVIVFLLLLIIHYNFNSIVKSDYVLFLDVGQGDSMIIHSNRKTILIDTGGRLNYKVEPWQVRNSTSSIADNTIIPLLKSQGIRKLDYLILTHGDYDHMGEAINLVETFKVEKVIFNCGDYNSLEKDLIKVLDKRNIKYDSCIKEINIDKYKLHFLNNREYDNENDNSNVIYTEFNNHKFLFMGDAGIVVEEDLLNKYNLNNIDVLKVGHHGSKTSSSKQFITNINPKYSVISVGKNNRYGHPNNEVLEILDESNIYRTDKQGSIMFRFKKNKLEINTCPP